MMNLSKVLYRLNKGDIKKAAEVLSRAFHNDADMKKLLPDEEVRKRKLKLIFEPFVRYGILYGEVYAPSSDIEGVSVWTLSSMNINTWRSLRSGFMGLMYRLDKEERVRFTEYGKEIDQKIKGILEQDHWFLFILGVDPKYQQQGFGTKLVKPMLERIDGEHFPVMLDTNKPKNLEFYNRFGFETAKEYQVLGNKHWGLVRQRR
jgi:GNAT superfamily N-acetyltransferase